MDEFGLHVGDARIHRAAPGSVKHVDAAPLRISHIVGAGNAPRVVDNVHEQELGGVIGRVRDGPCQRAGART